MNKRQGVQLVSELEAERILHARGYSKEVCPACNGEGHFSIAGAERYACDRCEGAKWIWKLPVPNQPISVCNPATT